jgi:O-antigen/teichoic acid export membrane protein
MEVLGAAITTLVAYAAMFFASLWWGQKHYPVPYNWTKLSAYVLGATAMVFLIHYTGIESVAVKLAMGGGYLLIMLMAERRGLFNFAR